MIEINSIEDLKSYAKYIPNKYNNGIESCISFEIMQEGKLADVSINCELELTIDFFRFFDMVEFTDFDKNTESYDIKFLAKNIYAKKSFVCGCVECENLYVEDKVAFTSLDVKGNIEGQSVSSMDLVCNYIDVDYLYCNFLNAANLYVRTLYSNDTVFSNVSYHNPVFPDELVKSWNGKTSIQNIDLVKNNCLPYEIGIWTPSLENGYEFSKKSVLA